jgi:hypothetical protein
MLLFAMVAGNSGGQWTATGPGPFNFDDDANWNGVISDEITNNPGSEQTMLFTDRSMGSENSVHHFLDD